MHHQQFNIQQLYALPTLYLCVLYLSESYLGGKRSTEAWRILKNLRKNENVGQPINPISIDKWETYFKELLTENKERYLRK
jgi:hypothetical protein